MFTRSLTRTHIFAIRFVTTIDQRNTQSIHEPAVLWNGPEVSSWLIPLICQPTSSVHRSAAFPYD